MSKRLQNLKFYIHTFGCQMNENDSERIAGLLLREGARLVLSPESSDLVVINTCAVREKSEEKFYSLLGRMGSLKKKTGLLIGVAGCVAQLHKSRMVEMKPFIDFVIGPDNYHELPRILSESSPEKVISTEWSRLWHEYSPDTVLRESSVSAYVTIMEGCNNFCAYCIVPFTRGREKYRPLSQVLDEVNNLASRGYKEVQLLGQNVNSYKDPDKGSGFPELLEEVNRVKEIGWIRFITSHPKDFTQDIAQAMRDSKKVCHQLHLPVQSGSSSVLKAMNRGYSKQDYLERIAFIRDLMPEISLSTDIIVGFPGETEKDYEETLDLLKQVRFTNIFSFRYSPRPLTAADNRRDDVPLAVKRKRLVELQKVQKQIQLKLNASQVGQVVKVLCSGRSKKDSQLYSGRNEGNQVVNFKSGKDVIGQFVHVRILSYGPYSLGGEAIQGEDLS